MESTVIGVYDSYEQAQNAINELVRAGFGRSAIQLTPGDQTADSRQSALRAAPQGGEAVRTERDSGESVIGQFFGKIFGTYSNTNDKANHGDVMSDAELYSESIRRGSYLLAVDARNDEQHDEIVNIMDRFGPIDIDERGAHWRMQGWSRYDSTAPVLSQEEIDRDRTSYTSRPAVDVTPSAQTGSAEYDTAGINRERRAVRVYPRSGELGMGAAGAAAGMDTSTTGATALGPDSDYRSHWQTNYGHLGGRYEDHAPAYQYGSRLASDQRYSNYHQWNDLEANARTDWESEHAGHPWEKAKDAVRYSWERVTNRGRQ